MDRRSLLVRAAAIATAAALPFQRVAERAATMLPAGARLQVFSQGPQAGYIGWVENELDHTIGWLTESGTFHGVTELVERGVLAR